MATLAKQRQQHYGCYIAIWRWNEQRLEACEDLRDACVCVCVCLS